MSEILCGLRASIYLKKMEKKKCSEPGKSLTWKCKRKKEEEEKEEEEEAALCFERGR